MIRHILRITEKSTSQGKYQVHIELMEEDDRPLTADVSFEFNLSPQDQERLRWYFEDYLEYSQEPSPSIARQVERLLKQIGSELFDKTFKSNEDARIIWLYIRPILNETRMEIITDTQDGVGIPWELMCDSDTPQPLVIGAGSFLRTYAHLAEPVRKPKIDKGPIRVLLAICRPGGDEDVPFRSVARRCSKHPEQG